MLHKCQMEVVIRKVDNGYVVEWTNGKYASNEEVSGVKVFTTLDQAIKFVKGLL